MNIHTLTDLQTHLQWAIEIEHSTIPPYLCALYSLNAQDTNNFEAMAIIQDVVVDEMLHLALDCNLLNAIGGSPTFNNPSFIPKYPDPLPHHTPNPPLVIHLQKCSVDVVNNTFLVIEKPETVNDIPEGDNYTTLGQFYAAISQGFTTVCASDSRYPLWETAAHYEAAGLLSSGPPANRQTGSAAQRWRAVCLPRPEHAWRSLGPLGRPRAPGAAHRGRRLGALAHELGTRSGADRDPPDALRG